MEDKDLNKKILESSEHFDVPFKRSVDEAWDMLEPKLLDEVKTRRFSYVYLKVAASLAFLVIMSYILSGYFGSVNVKSGEQIVTHILPDGSVVTLNEGTEIAYNDWLWMFDRSLSMEGRAYFDVNKGKKFSVITSKGRVSVLGTEFDVLDMSGDYKVYCFEGNVEVSNRSLNQKIELSEGLATELNNNNLTNPFPFNKEKISAWKNGLFYFEQENLEKVFAQLEEHYKVNIVLNTDISDKKFSGVFKKGNLKTALEIVCSSMSLDYEIEGEKVSIRALK